MVRIQVLVDEKERETFRQIAEHQGLSLSAWFRQLAVERAQESAAEKKINSVTQLQRFFRDLNRRHKGQGREADWDEHLAIMERSRSSGRSET